MVDEVHNSETCENGRPELSARRTIISLEQAPKKISNERELSVSVVVPAYNAATTIGDALASLLVQTYPHWEAIVVDDGSSDCTSKVANSFVARDRRIRLVQRMNGGESAARNTGIAEARYDWLLFLDADDWISPIHLERLTGELATRSEMDAVICGYTRVALDGTHAVERYSPPTGDMFATLARRAAFPVHTCIVRKMLVADVGGFDTSLRRSADWDLWQRVARTGACFGAVHEVLAFYRMQPSSASLDASLLLEDGLRVLRRGHGPDPRVPHPDPRHAVGLPREPELGQEFYLLSWCAGLLIGSNKDARPLLEAVKAYHCSRLYPDAIASCIFEAVPLATCQTVASWEQLWPDIQDHTKAFLTALQHHSGTPNLAERALMDLKKRVLQEAPSWSPVVDRYDRALARHQLRIDQLECARAELEERLNRQRQLASERGELLAEKQAAIEELQQGRTRLENEVDRVNQTLRGLENAIGNKQATIEELQQSRTELAFDLDRSSQLARKQESEIAEKRSLIEQLTQLRAELESKITASRREVDNHTQKIDCQHAQIQERNDNVARLQTVNSELVKRVSEISTERESILHSAEHRTGDLLLNRARLRRPVEGIWSLSNAIRHDRSVARLRAECRKLERRGQFRVLTTICSTFPIYSQTFVYQELNQLIRQGFSLRLIYSELVGRENLNSQFTHLWNCKERLVLDRRAHQQDYATYCRRMPAKVDALIDLLCQASGLFRQALVTHDNFLQSFSFTRLVEAYQPHYLHSYFFYDRSLMALVAGYLLDIPRGVTCYADHRIQDYELKVVPLHLKLCDVVVATSERIKEELLELSPQTDPERILVKPNGIDTECFLQTQRTEPEDGAPFRIVTVCRIEPKKGLLDLVEAVHLLRERGVNVEAHIVGAADEWSEASRSYKRKLDERISERQLWGTVHLEGRRDLEDVRRFLEISQLFVAPFVETEFGDKDGIPTALLEAMATGLPAVATDAGSISEVIDDGLQGVIVPQQNSTALADAIESLLRDPNRRQRLGKAGADKVRAVFDVRACERVFHERVELVRKCGRSS